MVKRRNEIESMVRSEPFAFIGEYDSDGNIEYEAWAIPGAATTDAVWICCKHTYNASQQLINTKWAKDSNNVVGDFTNLASSLSGLTYV